MAFLFDNGYPMTFSFVETRSCVFTGHRPKYLAWGDDENDKKCLELKELLYEQAEKLVNGGINHFVVGMSTGCDFYFAETILKLREKYVFIKLECAIPYEEQHADWNEKYRERWFDIVCKCDIETRLQTHYSSDCHIKRNEYMVNKSEVVIAVSKDVKHSGTTSIVNYALDNGKKVITINADDLKININN